MSEWPYQVEVAMDGDRGIYFRRLAEWCANYSAPFKTYDGLRTDAGIRVTFKTSVPVVALGDREGASKAAAGWSVANRLAGATERPSGAEAGALAGGAAVI